MIKKERMAVVTKERVDGFSGGCGCDCNWYKCLHSESGKEKMSKSVSLWILGII